ncbi:NAD-dependent epimerase/dehydratase family protein [Bradyrhizobium lablabi]|uniref:NAD-dependent epimerase/dehydratase family protein n=1 Tax=Bradyrhizobium lablabi TaxID=722472 RepID=UPI00090AFCCC|nr:NAD-dependent epimerase/dehydratase family protein [Bradyrhizobium lablabi]SHM80694.1 UDP-glucose 4-epimerase [Bradyrhizobium lablabi]
MSFRILVTGSSGFVGSAVVSALTAAGHSVCGASRSLPLKLASKGVEWMCLPDLRGQIDWDSMLLGMDVVVHLAGIAHRSGVGSEDYDSANRLATASLARACRRRMVKRLIFMSSIGAQTGSAAEHVVTEADEPRPVTEYDKAKLAAEVEVRNSDVPYTILRPVIVYGPGAKANIALIMRIADLPLLLPFGAFRNRRSLVSIDNLSQAVLFCISHTATAGNTYIVADREPITLAEIFTTIREASGRSPGLISIPPVVIKTLIVGAGYQSLWDKIGRELVASSASLREVGWTPQTDTRAGLFAMAQSRQQPPSR